MVTQRHPEHLFTGKLLLVFVALAALAWIACNPMNIFKNRAVQRLPGIQAITGPIPPVYTASILGVKMPQSVAVAPDGNRLYVAEGDGDRGVRMVDLRTRTLLGSLTPPETTPGDRKPMSVALGRGGIVYVVDRRRSVVDMYDPTGQWLGMLPEPLNSKGLWEPLAVAVNAEGLVYVTNANPGGPALVEYNGDGRLLTSVGPTGGNPSPLSFPTGIAMGANGYAFIADSNAGRVVAMDEAGAMVRTYGKTVGLEALALPRGVAIDRRGFMYVTDVTNDDVKVWDISTDPATFLFTFGSSGFADGELLYPNSVAADSNGRIYVADTGNDRVQIWAY